ncbi:MAG: sugar transferase [Chloroflexi bacterium]|nr:sugar transferase [Chloroflexota bacterium]
MGQIQSAQGLDLFMSRSSRNGAGMTSDYSRQWLIFLIGLLVFDALAVMASLVLAFTIRISSGLLTYSAPHQVEAYLVLILISGPIWVVLFAANGLYRRDNLLGGSMEYQLTVKACTAGIVVLIIMSFLSRELVVVSRVWLLLAWAFSVVMVVLERFLARRLAYMLRGRGWFTANVLIVGANDQGIAMAEQWRNSSTSGMRVIGFVDDFKPAGTVVLHDLKVLGRPTALAQLAEQMGVQEVVVVPNAVAWETFEEIIAQASTPKSYRLRISPGFYELLNTGVEVTNQTFVPLFTINEARIVGVDAALKTALDYGLGSLLFMVTWPIMAAVAIALKLSNWYEPILTSHHTVGQGGVVFPMLKFNTSPIAAKLNHQNALAWLHRVLYLMGLDKLPQIFNVLLGQMSLVGPRPRVVGSPTVDPRKVNSLQAVKPGMFGPWLVEECWSSNESRDEFYYVRNWTIWLDLQILAQVALSLLRIRRKVRAIPARLRGGERLASTGTLPLNSPAMQNIAAASVASPERNSQSLSPSWHSSYKHSDGAR